MEPTNEQTDTENQEYINENLGSSESELVKRGKEYGLTPERPTFITKLTKKWLMPTDGHHNKPENRNSIYRICWQSPSN